MIIEIGSNMFKGFYNSIFSYDGEFYYMEQELKDELIESLDINKEFEVYYEYENFDKYKLDICNKFMELYVESIIDVLPYWIKEFEFFKFDIVEDSLIVVSPKYYNYSTDKCYCKVETNIETLNLIKQYVLKMNNVEKYLIDNFTSHDGFISFVSNDINIWKQWKINKYSESMLNCLFDMLLYLDYKDCIDNINIEVIDCVDKYEYVYPMIYYDGKDYEVEEFKKLMNKNL